MRNSLTIWKIRSQNGHGTVARTWFGLRTVTIGALLEAEVGKNVHQTVARARFAYQSRKKLGGSSLLDFYQVSKMGQWRELGFRVKIAKMEDQVGTMGAKRENNDWIGAILRSGRQNGHETARDCRICTSKC